MPNLGLHLDDETVRVSVALRLGATICESHRCRLCASPVTPLGLHGLSCLKSAGRHPRHAHLNDVVRRSLASAGFPAATEPVGLDRGDGRRPDGLTVFPFREGKCLTWDATCVDTFADSVLVQSALEPGAAARQAEERKRQRYREISRRYIFVPVAIETSGVYGPAAAAFIQDLGRRISARTGERRETAWLRQRLSIAIARGNAASVLASAPRGGAEAARPAIVAAWPQRFRRRKNCKNREPEAADAEKRRAEEQHLPEGQGSPLSEAAAAETWRAGEQRLAEDQESPLSEPATSSSACVGSPRHSRPKTVHGTGESGDSGQPAAGPLGLTGLMLQGQFEEQLEADRQERRRQWSASGNGGAFGPLIMNAEKLAPSEFEIPWGELFGARPKHW